MSRIDRGFYCHTGNTGKQKKVLVRAKKTTFDTCDCVRCFVHFLGLSTIVGQRFLVSCTMFVNVLFV